MPNFTVRYEATTEADTPLQAALTMWLEGLRQGPSNPMLEVLSAAGDEPLLMDLWPFDDGPAGHLKTEIAELGATAIEVEAVLDNEGEVLTVDTPGGPWNAIGLYFRLSPDFYGVCVARHIEDYRYDDYEDEAYRLALELAETLGDCLHLSVVLKPSLKLAGLVA